MKVPKAYLVMAKAIIESYWDKPLDKGQQPVFSKAQLRDIIQNSIDTKVAQDGDPKTWIECTHCDEGLYYRNPTPEETQRQDSKIDVATGLVAGGICYQCWGKGWQSEADRRRNWGYQARRNEP
jgi:hypothetical protein